MTRSPYTGARLDRITPAQLRRYHLFLLEECRLAIGTVVTQIRALRLHCVVPAGGLSPDHDRWIHPRYAGFFLPVKVVSRIFRGKFVEALRRAYDRNELDLSGGSEHLRAPAAWCAFVDALFETDWVVYAKPAFGGATAVLRYLGRYTHRVAISNHRLLAFDGGHVTFSYKDYAHGDQRRTMTLTAMEFLPRFVQHILPRSFVRIRQSGFLANTCRTARVILARTLLATPSAAAPDPVAPTTEAPTRTTWACPRCGAVMTSDPSSRRCRSPPPPSASTRHDGPPTRYDSRLHQRAEPRVRSRVSRSQKPAPDQASSNRTRTRPCPRRRRSRVDGCPIDRSPRAEILIPAP